MQINQIGTTNEYESNYEVKTQYNIQLNCPIIPLLKLHAMNLLLDAAHGVNIVATGMALAQRNVIITKHEM